MSGRAQRRQFPRSAEDWSIVQWWRDHPRQGRLWVEVGIGRAGPGAWPNRRSSRDLDAVHIPGHPIRAVREWGDCNEDLADEVEGWDVEIVEAKAELNAAVIGQCLAGIDMFARAYPPSAVLSPVAVVRGEPDRALRWVCHRRGIEMARYSEDHVRDLQQHGNDPPFQ